MMKVPLTISIALAALLLLPGLAAAQCEGGSSTAGYYARSGAYVPGGCASSNPPAANQLYPSGASLPAGTTPSPVGQIPALGSGLPGASPSATLPAAPPNATNPLPGSAGGAGLSPLNAANATGISTGRGVSTGLASPPAGGAGLALGAPSISGLGPSLDTGLSAGSIVTAAGGIAYPGGPLGPGGAPPAGSVGAAGLPAGVLSDASPGAAGASLDATAAVAGAGAPANSAATQIILDGGSAYGGSLPAAPPPGPSGATLTSPASTPAVRGGPTGGASGTAPLAPAGQ